MSYADPFILLDPDVRDFLGNEENRLAKEAVVDCLATFGQLLTWFPLVDLKTLDEFRSSSAQVVDWSKRRIGRSVVNSVVRNALRSHIDRNYQTVLSIINQYERTRELPSAESVTGYVNLFLRDLLDQYVTLRRPATESKTRSHGLSADA